MEDREPAVALPRAFFERPADELAPALLGCRLVRRTEDGSVAAGLIVETEAYDGPADGASHARFGRTARTATMFGPGGRAYVYLVYGLHHLFNVVAGPDGVPGAVLVRALVPLAGLTAMADRRGAPAERPARLAAGPGRLTQALAIDRALDATDLTRPGPLWLAPPPGDAARALAGAGIAVGPRVGVDYAGPAWVTRPWRFGWRGHGALSRPFPPGA